MVSLDTLRAKIASYFTGNGANEITGPKLNEVTSDIINYIDSSGGSIDIYNQTTTYNTDNFVSYIGNVWKYINVTPSAGKTPGSEPLYWELSSAGLTAHTHTNKTILDNFNGVLSTVISGLSTATNAVITATDTVISAFGKLQKQISDNLANSITLSTVLTGLSTATNAVITASDSILGAFGKLQSQINSFFIGTTYADLYSSTNIALTGTITIDGLSSDNLRVAAFNQTTATQNGIYTGNSGGAWTRVSDFNSDTAIRGKEILIRQGSSYGGRKFYNTNTSVITVGSTNITFDKINIYAKDINISGKYLNDTTIAAFTTAISNIVSRSPFNITCNGSYQIFIFPDANSGKIGLQSVISGAAAELYLNPYGGKVGINTNAPTLANLEIKSTATTTLGSNCTLHLYNLASANALSQIGFSYSSGIAPAVIAGKSPDGSGLTSPIIFATVNRSDYTTNPIERLEINKDGGFVYNTGSATKTVNTTIISTDLRGYLPVVGTGGNVNCTSVAAGTDGQVIKIVGTDNTNTVTFNGSTANVILNSASSIVFTKGYAKEFIYSTAGSINAWSEII